MLGTGVYKEVQVVEVGLGLGDGELLQIRTQIEAQDKTGMESPRASLGLRLAHDMFFEAHFIDLPLYGLITGVHASLGLDNHSATISLVFIHRHWKRTGWTFSTFSCRCMNSEIDHLDLSFFSSGKLKASDDQFESLIGLWTQM